jgi:hypothetical protein
MDWPGPHWEIARQLQQSYKSRTAERQHEAESMFFMPNSLQVFPKIRFFSLFHFSKTSSF